MVAYSLLVYLSKRLTSYSNHHNFKEYFMQNTIFSTASDSFLVSHILHAGPVGELSQQTRKSENTHYFKLTTTRGAAYCHFRSEEAARRSRGVLGAMLGTVKPHLFRSKGDSIDIASIVSFGRIVTFKNDSETDVYGFPVVVASVADKSAAVWLRFQTEESAQNVRKALYAALMSFYNNPDIVSLPGEVPENNAVQAEVAYADV